MLKSNLRPALLMTLMLMIVTGLLYPGVITGLGRLLFPYQAGGSLVVVGGQVVGSELMGQSFARPEYFHPRPSAAGAGYDATASAGSNKGPTDRKLADTLIADAVRTAREANNHSGAIPADMATRSGSGLDPHISPGNAALQVARVAAARGAPPERVREILEQHTELRTLGFLGEPRVNVLMLNIALDRELPLRAGSRLRQ